jgi:hypothetical protein
MCLDLFDLAAFCFFVASCFEFGTLSNALWFTNCMCSPKNVLVSLLCICLSIWVYIWRQEMRGACLCMFVLSTTSQYKPKSHYILRIILLFGMNLSLSTTSTSKRKGSRSFSSTVLNFILSLYMRNHIRRNFLLQSMYGTPVLSSV